MSTMNLLPEDYVAHQAQKRANLMCLSLFAVVIVGLAAAAIVSERKHRRTSEVCERVNQSYDEAGKLIRQMQSLDITREEMFKRANVTAALLERIPRSYLLAAVTNALPKGASLTKFELRTKCTESSVASQKPKSKNETAANGKSPAPKTVKKMEVSIAVAGLANTDVEVGRFIATMDRCELIESVDLVFSQEKTVKDSVVREFEVILYLKENADVRSQQPNAEAAAEAGGADERES